MANIRRKFPGKSDHEIYLRVHQVMEGIASEMSLAYETDGARKRGKVAKMGITGAYAVTAGEVTVDLSYPMLVPGSMRKKVEAKIEQKLDGLFA
jgi:Putative polyhydroxyalkanoic acid system protein (PHA_gran_rgn)